MPIYDYSCSKCGWAADRIVPVDERDSQWCPRCETYMLLRLVSTPAQAQFRGRVVQGGGPDRFTADVMGIPLRDLPSGLKTSSR